MKRKVKKIFFLISLISGFLYWQNNGIVITKHYYKNKKIPKNFRGFKIAQISDLQNKMFYNNQSSIINKLKSQNPDIIVITGDILDSNRTNVNNAYVFIDKAINIAPIYYVSGNHENRLSIYNSFINILSEKGVNVLENKYSYININNEKIVIMGIRDIRNNKNFEDIIKNMSFKNEKYFKILLSHRPELYNIYENNNIDLSFVGHSHGGQIRLPFTDGLFAPNQGILPKYTSGLRHFNKSSMIISRGLGNSRFPFRIFNRPEITITTLYNE